MQGSVNDFLEQVARRGSWVGGGSVAALAAALAAALLEKLLVQPSIVRLLRRRRAECEQLIERDAATFSAVIKATRQHRREAFQRSLKVATEVPCRVFEHAQAIQAACRRATRTVKPRFQSDLRCAMALALASGESARTLIETNLAWLNDPRYTRTIRNRLQHAARSNVR